MTDVFTVPETEERPDRKRRRWPWILVSVIVIALLGAAGVGAAYLWNVTRSFDEAVETLPEVEVFPEAEVRPEPAKTDAQTILLVGSDVRGNVGDDLEAIRGQRADTIMVVRIPADREGVQVVSIMRDNWVDIPRFGSAKINAALAFGGMPLLVETVEGMIGSRIDHVAIIDFDGFEGLTNALGGVTVNNQKAFTGRGTRFEQGPITLNGEDALKFVRERYAFTDGDYQRVRNQQAYIKGLISTLLSRETLTNPTRVADAVAQIAPYLTVDEGLGSGYLIGLAPSLASLRADDVSFITSPTLGTGMIGSQSVVHVDWEGWEALRTAFQEDTLAEYIAAVQG